MVTIVNAYTKDKAGWYPRGQERLLHSLQGWGYNGNLHIQDDFLTDEFDRSCGYNIKADALLSATHKGIVIWLDCSVFPVKPIDGFIEMVKKEGCYFWTSGYTLGQTCNTATLDYFKITRKQAHNIPDCSSSIFALDLDTNIGQIVRNMFIRAAMDGLFIGGRDKLPQTIDCQIFEHRQDQSVLSCIIHVLKLKMYEPNIYSMYDPDDRVYPNTVYFSMRGGI